MTSSRFSEAVLNEVVLVLSAAVLVLEPAPLAMPPDTLAADRLRAPLR